MDSDVIIIGAGMGGLFAGAFLAREGLRVTLLEKNRGYGGGLSNFVRNGESYETGMHVAGGFYPGGNLYEICSYLGIADRLSMTDADIMAHVIDIRTGREFDLPSGSEAFVRSLSREFPDSAAGIEAYVKALQRVASEERRFFFRNATDGEHSDEFTMPADEFIAKYISDTDLRRLLAFQRPLYAGVDGQTPAFLHAMISSVFMERSQFFTDGSQSLADLLACVIEKAGGQILTADGVTRVNVEDGQVTYVETLSGKRYQADWYVSDIHPCALVEMSGDKAFPSYYVRRLHDIPDTSSAFKLYVRLKQGRLSALRHPVFIIGVDGWPFEEAAFMCPDKTDPEFCSHMTVLAEMQPDEVHQWQDTRTGHRGAEYSAWKKSRMDRMMELLERAFPGIADNVAECFGASPLTFRDWTGSRNGSMYGYRKDSGNLLMSMLSVRTKVRNLLLTGQNVNMHGIGGVPMTAIDTAEYILGRNYIIDRINKTIN